jgi:WD40 repeat protein
VQVSERPVLCSAVMQDGSGDIVVGSSDHALYVVDTQAGRTRRTLYSKTKGHTEWVTTVCCLPGGRVLSGGMDGCLWLWPAAGAGGCELKAAHSGPVSKVAALPGAAAAADNTADPVERPGRLHTGSRTSSGSKLGSDRGTRAGSSSKGHTVVAAGVPVLAASCSYDQTVKLWSVAGQVGRQVAVMEGHRGPVLELVVAPQGDALLTGRCWCEAGKEQGALEGGL